MARRPQCFSKLDSVKRSTYRQTSLLAGIKVLLNMGNAQILDKAQGALIGSALGDAIGIFTGITAVLHDLSE
jgi:hypothetical protein